MKRKVPKGYWDNLDVEELKRRTIHSSLTEENYPSLRTFRLPLGKETPQPKVSKRTMRRERRRRR